MSLWEITTLEGKWITIPWFSLWRGYIQKVSKSASFQHGISHRPMPPAKAPGPASSLAVCSTRKSEPWAQPSSGWANQQPSTTEFLQTKIYLIQALVEIVVKGQFSQRCWQSCARQALVEVIAKCQCLQRCWQHCPVQASVETIPKSQVLQRCW